MKLLKKTLLVLSIAIAATAVLAVQAILVLNADFAQRRARKIINGIIPGSITWESLRISPLTGRVEITKALLTGEDRAPIAGFDRLRARISVWSALRGKLDIAEARLEKPVCLLALDRDGRLNIVKAFGILPEKQKAPGKPAGLPGFLVVGKCVLEKGRFGFARPSSNFELDIGDISATAGLNFRDETGSIELTIGRGYFTAGGRRTDLKRLTLSSAVTGGIAERLRLKLQTTASDLAIEGDIEELFRNPAFNISARYAISLSELHDILNMTRPLNGTVNGAFRARGTVNNPAVSLTGDYSGGAILGNRVDAARADISMEDRVVTINTVKALAGAGSLELRGSISLRDACRDGFIRPNRDPDMISYAVTAAARNYNIGNIPGLSRNARGLVNADISFSARGVYADTMSALMDLKGSITNFSIGTKAAPAAASLQARASMEDGILRVDALEADLGNARLRAGGSIDTAAKSMRGAFSVQSKDIGGEASALGLGGCGGSARMEGSLSGTIRRPVVAVTLSGEAIHVRDIAIGDLFLGATLDGAGAITVTKFTLSNGESRVALSGAVGLFNEGLRGLRADPPITLDIERFAVSPGDFDGRFGGALTLTGRVSGSVRDPRGALALSGANLNLRIQRFKSLDCTVNFRDRKAIIDPLLLTLSPGEAIRCDGWIGTDRSYDFTMTSDPISLTRIQALEAAEGLQGRMTIDMKGKGFLGNPALGGSIAATGLTYGDTAYDDMIVRVTMADHRISFKGRMNFDLEGSYDLRDRGFTAAALFDRTDLTPYLAAAGRKSLGGAVTGTVRASGNAAAPARSDLRLSLGQLELFSEGRRLVTSRKCEAVLSKGIFTIPGINLSLLDSGWIAIGGRGNLSGPLAVTCDARVPLELANRFTDSLTNFTGTLSVKGGLTGTAQRPRMSAVIGLDRIGFFIPAINNDIRDLTGGISLSPDRVTLDRIRGNVGEGVFSIGGSMAARGLKLSDIRVNAAARNIPVEITDTMRMTFDANARITGNSARTLLRGDVTVLEGIYYQDLVLRPLQEIGAVTDRPTKAADEKARRTILDSIIIDAAVRTRSPFAVENNIAGLKIASDLRIAGTAATPVLIGSARVESGVIHYLGRDFDIVKGKIDFINPYRIEPLISISSNARIQKWLVSIAVSGTPSTLRYDLSSSPVLDSNNILSLVMLGKTTGGAMTYSASDLLGQLIAFNYGGQIKKSTGIDTLEVKAPDPKTGKGQSVTIGKYLDRRFSVYYTVGKDSKDIRTASTVKYRLNDSVLLDLKYDSKGEVGIDMQYNKEFR